MQIKKQQLEPYIEQLWLLPLSRFSCVDSVRLHRRQPTRLPRSLGFSRQEHRSGLPFPSPMHESENESEVTQSCLTLSDPMDCSLPGSSIHGIFQARVLEWGAIAFSDIEQRTDPNWERSTSRLYIVTLLI